MRRLVIFTLLFPPLVLSIYVIADRLLTEGLPGIEMLAGLIAISYALLVIPAWLTAGLDWAVSSRPLYIRLVATMPLAAILAEFVARYMGQPQFDVPVAIAGAIPAGICSWLSDKPLIGAHS